MSHNTPADEKYGDHSTVADMFSRRPQAEFTTVLGRNAMYEVKVGDRVRYPGMSRWGIVRKVDYKFISTKGFDMILTAEELIEKKN